MKKFCIDSCSLITHMRYAPPHIHKSLWQNVADEIEKGNIVAPEQVKDELNRGYGPATEWIKTNSDLFVIPTSEEIEFVREVQETYPFLCDEEAEYEQADPYLIAVSKQRNLTLITEESTAKRKKIPRVCNELKIQTLNFVQMVEWYEWTF